MLLENIVVINVQSLTRGVTQRDFGIPMIIGVHTNTQETVKTYSGTTVLSDLVTDGFVASDPIYRCAAAFVSSTNRPQYIKVGKLATSFNQTFEIAVPNTVEEDKVYSFNLISPAGVTTAISYTALLADTPTTVAAALTALITAVVGITATSLAEVISCVADNADEMWLCEDIDPNNLQYDDTTVDSNLATELAANDTIDSDYYCLALADPNSEARVLALAAYIETKEKIYAATTHDYDVLDSTSTDDVMYDAKAASYKRTYIFYSSYQSRSVAAGLAGYALPNTPGSQTWAYKEVSGVSVEDKLTTAHWSSIQGKNGNYYTAVQGLNATIDGRMASGAWIDSIRGRDHFVQRLRERIWQVFANDPKVPYTDAGIAKIVAQERGQVAESGANGYIDLERPVTYTFPKASEVSAANKANRILPGISVSFYEAGAIHTVNPLTVTIQL